MKALLIALILALLAVHALSLISPIAYIGASYVLLMVIFLLYIRFSSIRHALVPIAAANVLMIFSFTIPFADAAVQTMVQYLSLAVLLAAFYPFAEKKINLQIKKIPHLFIEVAFIAGIVLAFVGYFLLGKGSMLVGSTLLERLLLPLCMGITEEILFRKYMLESMLIFFRPVFAILFTVLFSLVFIPFSWQMFVFTVLSQLVFSLLFIRSKNLFYSSVSNISLKYILIFILKG